MDWQAIINSIPTIIVVAMFLVTYERRLTRLETKVDMIMTTIEMLPKRATDQPKDEHQ